MAKPIKYPDYPGVIDRKNRDGSLKLIFRFQTGNEKTLPSDMSSPAFAKAYEECRLLNGGPAPEKPKKKETFEDAWFAYKASEEYLKLDFKTQGRHNYYWTEFRDAPVKKGSKSTFKGVYISTPDTEILPLLREYLKNAKADLPYRTAGLLRKLYRAAIDAKYDGVLRNIGNDLDVKKPESKGGHPEWPEGFIQRYNRFHQKDDMAIATLALARFLGNRRGDVALLDWRQLVVREIIEDGRLIEEWSFAFRQRKNQNRTGGAKMFLPVSPELKEILERPALVESRKLGGAVIKSELGRGFTINSIGNKFRDWCDEAGIPEGYSLHGLRANFASDLAVTGIDIYALRDAMGHSSVQTTEIYLKSRNQEHSASKIRQARKAHKASEQNILDFKRKNS